MAGSLLKNGPRKNYKKNVRDKKHRGNAAETDLRKNGNKVVKSAGEERNIR